MHVSHCEETRPPEKPSLWTAYRKTKCVGDKPTHKQYQHLVVQFKLSRSILEGFVVIMREGACEQEDVLFAKTRVHCDNKPHPDRSVLIYYYIMILVKFQTSANQKHWIWSCEESGLGNPWLRLLGDEVIVGSSLMFRKRDAWHVIRKLQDKTNKNQL